MRKPLLLLLALLALAPLAGEPAGAAVPRHPAVFSPAPPIEGYILLDLLGNAVLDRALAAALQAAASGNVTGVSIGPALCTVEVGSEGFNATPPWAPGEVTIYPARVHVSIPLGIELEGNRTAVVIINDTLPGGPGGAKIVYTGQGAPQGELLNISQALTDAARRLLLGAVPQPGAGGALLVVIGGGRPPLPGEEVASLVPRLFEAGEIPRARVTMMLYQYYALVNGTRTALHTPCARLEVMAPWGNTTWSPTGPATVRRTDLAAALLEAAGEARIAANITPGPGPLPPLGTGKTTPLARRPLIRPLTGLPPSLAEAVVRAGLPVSPGDINISLSIIRSAIESGNQTLAQQALEEARRLAQQGLLSGDELRRLEDLYRKLYGGQNESLPTAAPGGQAGIDIDLSQLLRGLGQYYGSARPAGGPGQEAAGGGGPGLLGPGLGIHAPSGMPGTAVLIALLAAAGVAASALLAPEALLGAVDAARALLARPPPGLSGREMAEWCYSAAVWLLGIRGVPKMPWETPWEYLERARRVLRPGLARALEELTEAFVRARYAEESPPRSASLAPCRVIVRWARNPLRRVTIGELPPLQAVAGEDDGLH